MWYCQREGGRSGQLVVETEMAGIEGYHALNTQERGTPLPRILWSSLTQGPHRPLSDDDPTAIHSQFVRHREH